ERADVLAVVPNHLDQRFDEPDPEEIEIATRDLPALDVLVALDAEQLGLDRLQASIRHPMPKDASDERQRVEVAGVSRWIAPGHPVARHEQGPVEAATVVRDKPRRG